MTGRGGVAGADRGTRAGGHCHGHADRCAFGRLGAWRSSPGRPRPGGSSVPAVRCRAARRDDRDAARPGGAPGHAGGRGSGRFRSGGARAGGERDRAAGGPGDIGRAAGAGPAADASGPLRPACGVGSRPGAGASRPDPISSGRVGSGSRCAAAPGTGPVGGARGCGRRGRDSRSGDAGTSDRAAVRGGSAAGWPGDRWRPPYGSCRRAAGRARFGWRGGGGPCRDRGPAGQDRRVR